jgi:DNA-binding PadR family transcriptional regulator
MVDIMNDAELALLSLLSEDTHSDIELHNLIEARGLRRWTAIGLSSMYYILDKLTQQGLIEPVIDALPVRCWRITPAGHNVLQTAVADLLGTPHPHARSFELGLVNAHLLKTSQIRTALYNYRQGLNTRQHLIRTELDKERAGSNLLTVSALYEHSLALIDAEIVWLNDFIKRWEAQVVEEPPPAIEPAKPIPRILQVVLPQDPDSVHKRTTLQGDFAKSTRRPRRKTNTDTDRGKS